MSDELLPVVHEHDNHTDQILKINDLHSNQKKFKVNIMHTCPTT